MNSCFSNREVLLKNIAIEPEVIDLIKFLNESGSNIRFVSKRSVIIKGVKNLKGIKYKIMPDRIEAGTYIIASAITNSSLTLNNLFVDHIKNIINVLKKTGLKFKNLSSTSIKVLPGKLKPLKVRYSSIPRISNRHAGTVNELISFDRGSFRNKRRYF